MQNTMKKGLSIIIWLSKLLQYNAQMLKPIRNVCLLRDRWLYKYAYQHMSPQWCADATVMWWRQWCVDATVMWWRHYSQGSRGVARRWWQGRCSRRLNFGTRVVVCRRSMVQAGSDSPQESGVGLCLLPSHDIWAEHDQIPNKRTSPNIFWT